MQFGFAFPLKQLHWWLVLTAVALGVIVIALRWLEHTHQSRLHRFVEAALTSRLLTGYDGSMRRPLFWLTALGFAFLAVAFAQPRWGQAWQEVRQVSRDVVMCLDTSESMRAPNPLPNRLERAKQKISSLLDIASGDRFGLVAFSGDAQLQCPLTLDHGYFRAVLGAIDTDTISLEGTDIAAAIREAVRTFEEDERHSQDYGRDSRAILVISDGEQVSGDAVAEAEKASKVAHVFVIGVGDPNGAEIQLPEFVSRQLGRTDVNKPHLSRLDEDMLRKVATAGGGAYVRARLDTWDIEQVFERFQILSARSVASDLRLQLVNRYQWPLALGIACFWMEGCWLVLMPHIRRWRAYRQSRAQGDEQHA